MFKHTLKSVVLTGATIMVLLSMTAPAAMAAPKIDWRPGEPLPGSACYPIYYPGCELKLYYLYY